jgi:tripartite-type tricarboxylate transporter receptor subunit TctC
MQYMILHCNTSNPSDPHKEYLTVNSLKILLVAGVLTLASLAGPACAGSADFPTRAISLIVPWPPGGSTDVALRELAQLASRHLGQTIVIENKPGASGTLGPASMAKLAKPDGYTISQVAVTQFRLPHMQPVSYDPVEDFTYIIGLSGYTFGVVVRADSPWKSWQEFAAFVKSNPGKVAYGSVGIGSSQHIAMQAIGEKAGFDWTHIPFKGSSDALTSLLGGHVHAVADSTGWAPHVAAGKMRLLATFGATRTAKWPDVPTLLDLGYDLVFDSPYGLAGPTGMDPAVVKTLHDAFRKALEDEAFSKTLEKLDQSRRYMDTAAYRRYAREAFVQEGELVRKMGLAAGTGAK